jgi:hypothetical protein
MASNYVRYTPTKGGAASKASTVFGTEPKLRKTKPGADDHFEGKLSSSIGKQQTSTYSSAAHAHFLGGGRDDLKCRYLSPEHAKKQGNRDAPASTYMYSSQGKQANSETKTAPVIEFGSGLRPPLDEMLTESGRNIRQRR